MKQLFVRRDYPVEGMKLEQNDFDEHVAYLKNVATAHLFLGGGYTNKNGGMIILEADDENEARNIFDADPIIKKGFYQYELETWSVLIKSKDFEGIIG